MKNYFEKEGLSNLSPQEKLDHLEGLADKVDIKPYIEYFSDEEIQEFQKVLSDELFKMDQLNEELHDVSSVIKDKIKIVQKSINQIKMYVKFKGRQVSDKVFLFADHVAGIASIYDKNGNVIEQRPLRPDERQTNIKLMVNKSAVNE